MGLERVLGYLSLLKTGWEWRCMHQHEIYEFQASLVYSEFHVVQVYSSI